jgi:hypothetical protein
MNDPTLSSGRSGITGHFKRVTRHLEAAVEEDRLSSPEVLLAEIRQLGLRSPREAAELIRADRDNC